MMDIDLFFFTSGHPSCGDTESCIDALQTCLKIMMPNGKRKKMMIARMEPMADKCIQSEGFEEAYKSFCK